MALQPVRLDDLTWSEMVLAIRGRIAAASGEKWSLHSPVDPGVTLLELFAWLLEQRIYWMDQVPDSFVRAALSLLGQTMRPAISAATVLQFPPKAYEIVSAQTEMRLLRRLPSLTFSTQQAFTLLPVDRIGLNIGNQDRTPDLEHGRVLRLFPSDGSAAEIQITLWLTQATTAAPPAEPFALFLDLRSSSKNTPQWLPDAVDEVPPPAEVTWWYRRAADQTLVQFREVDDGTSGLRRSGVVRLSLPADWLAEGPAESGATPYALWIRVDKSTFTAPPRLERILANVAIARHSRQTREHALRRQWLPLPGRMITLSELPESEPEKDHPAMEQSVELQIRERDDQWWKWSPVADLSFSGHGDRVFVVDRERGELRFGDGLNGRIPVLAASDGANIKVRYTVGGGTAGNLGASLNFEAVDVTSTLTARNLVPAEGGQDSETIAEARERAASLLKQLHRAVTPKDHEELALTTPGVAIKRAKAAIGFHPDHPCLKVPGAVTLFIVPESPREELDEDLVESAFVAAPVVDPGALSAVRARLDAARLVASEIYILNARYRPVGLTITVEGDPAQPVRIREQLQERMKDFLDPLVGGDGAQGWPFGEPLRPSVLLREAQRVLAEAGQATAIAIRVLDTQDPAEDCQDVRIGEHELVTLQEFNVRLRPTVAARPGQGGLR